MQNEKYLLSFNGHGTVVALNEEGYIRDVNHCYIIYKDSTIKGFLSQATMLIINHYLGAQNQTINKWKTDRRFYTVNWKEPKTGNNLKSNPINYSIISEKLRTRNKFSHQEFNLPPMECMWLDMSIDISINFHKFDEGTTIALNILDGTPQQQYGESYPIKPRLDREGHIFTTFQPQLLRRIVAQRKKLIEESNNALGADWVLDLRNLINDSISIIDITLNQIYNKAEFGPYPDWNFDKNKLGVKNNRRIKDKLKWVRQITGNPFNIETEYPKLETLRQIRNHLNHFDPPTVVVTLEEATDWINDVLYIGQILIKIRQALKVPISAPLIDLIIQKEAVFNPETAFKNRLPLEKGSSGYTTSIWTEETD